MKDYTILTKPYRIYLSAFKHKLKHSMKKSRLIDFKRGTEMWCCKAECDDHAEGVSLIVFNHSWLSSFALDSNSLKKNWMINEITKGNWEFDVQVLNASFDKLNIMYPGRNE